MRIDRITIAVTHMDAMVRFYNAVFDAGLKPGAQMGGFQFYGGTLAEIELLFCPNEIAGVVAEQNREQFRIVVDDLEKVRQQAIEAGGSALDDVRITTTSKIAGLRDPDGNTIELIQYL
jgi:predicted enzyme related to lactoylglutathione lyase